MNPEKKASNERYKSIQNQFLLNDINLFLMRYKMTIQKGNARKKETTSKKKKTALPSKTVFDLLNDAEISVFTSN